MDPVVEHDVDQVGGCLAADHRQRAEVHQQRAVPVQDHDGSLRMRQRHTEADGGGVAHGALHVEGARRIGHRERVTAGEARGGDDSGLRRGGGDDPNGLRGRQSLGVRVVGRGGLADGAAFDEDERGPLLGEILFGLLQDRGELLHAVLRVQGVVRCVDAVEELGGRRSHHLVLRLVRGRVGPAAQTGEGQDRQFVGHHQRGERVDEVAETGVLQHHIGTLSTQGGTGGHRQCVAFVRRGHVAARARAQVCDRPAEMGAGNTTGERESTVGQQVTEFFCGDHMRGSSVSGVAAGVVDGAWSAAAAARARRRILMPSMMMGMPETRTMPMTMPSMLSRTKAIWPR